MYVFIHVTSPLSLTCVFSPGIIHGAHPFLPISFPTSPDLTRPYSAVHYPQILRLKDRCVISCLVCVARRYSLVTFIMTIYHHGDTCAGVLLVINLVA